MPDGYKVEPGRRGTFTLTIWKSTTALQNPDKIQVKINFCNLIKDIKNKEFKDINYEDFEKQKTYEDFKDIGQLNEETLLKNVDNKKRYYEDIDEEKIHRNDAEELFNEEYLLINDEDNDKDNDQKCCIKSNIKDIKKEQFMEIIKKLSKNQTKKINLSELMKG